MPIITIFGGTFGDDEELARNVAAKLGCQFVSREIFVAASQRADVPEAKLSDIVEKEPHWWERWHENLRPYQIALQAAVSGRARRESCLPGTCRAWVASRHPSCPECCSRRPWSIASEQVSKRRVRPKGGAPLYRSCRKARTRRLMALFGSDWCDPGQYALILNMAQMSSVAAENMIAHAANLLDYQAG